MFGVVLSNGGQKQPNVTLGKVELQRERRHIVGALTDHREKVANCRRLVLTF